MTRRILAGDVGATKGNLALFEYPEDGGEPVPVRHASYPSNDSPDLESMIALFLGPEEREVAAAAFGIAGPVLDGKVTGVNFPWTVEEEKLRRALGCEHVRLLNDMATTAYGTLAVRDEEILTLQEGVKRDGNRAVIAAGTGLGQSFLYWDGVRYHPSGTEGGHTDFGPRDERERKLLEYLLTRYERVSYERILSGPGLHNLFRFLTEVEGRPIASAVARRLEVEDPNAVVGAAGVDGTCPTCEEAVDWFVSIYEAQAGNLALTVMATGGVYVGGGIVTKMLAKMETGDFVASFLGKGRYREFMSGIPIRILLDPKASMIGAVHAAAEMLEA